LTARSDGTEKLEQQESSVANRAPIFALLAAEAISQIGNMMTIVAGPWFVLQTTGSAAKTGIVAGALAIGAVVPAVLGGPLVDRLGFKRASVLADVASAATVAAIPVLHLAGALAFWHLLVLVFVLSSLNAQGDTARYALVPALARRAGMPIERVNAADRAIVRLGQVVGPLVAGVLIALIGASNVLFVDAATFSLSAVFVFLGVPSIAKKVGKEDVKGGRRYFGELLEGLRFVRGSGFLLSMVLVATVGNFMDKPLVAVIAPVYADAIYGSPTALGIVVGAFGAGALAGSLLFGAVGRGWPRRATFLSCFVTGPVVIYGTLALTPPLAVLVAAAVVAGLIFGPVNPLFATVVQENTPPRMLGRAFGALTALAMAGIPLGAALVGLVVEGVGLVPTVLGMGAIYLAVTLGMFLNPALYRMDAGRKRRLIG
jgi:MFS family permease